MAVQQLTQPIVNPIAAFDATRAHTINFTVIGGAQVVGNRLVISDNETGTEIYNNKQLTMKLEHTVPAGTLSNGGYYNAVIYTVDNSGAESVASTAVPFYCYSQPVLTIDNIPQTETIENGTYAFVGSYLQQEDEPLNSYQYTLYNSNKEVLSQSALIYYEADSSLSYTFVGMSNDTAYYISLTGETVNGTKITSGLRYFTVRYLQPASFAICDLVNNCEDGYIQISSNIVAIDGKSNPDPPVYIDDKEVDLREPDTWVRWNEGFRIQNDFTMRVWGRDFNPYEKIITLTNDINTTTTPNKIELKWMLADVIKELPTYVSAKGLNVNLTDSKVGDIQNLTISGNSVEDKDNITEFIINGNSKQETTVGYNLCPSFDSGTWALSNGAKIENDTLILPDSSSRAESDFIDWNYRSPINVRFLLVSGDNYHVDLSYYNENKEQITGNGNAKSSLTPNSIIKPFTNYSPSVLSQAKYVKFTFQRSTSYAPNEYSVSNVQISAYDKDYEPYTGGIPSPNPDYPQDIEVIDSANRFDINKYQGIDCVLNGSATVTDTEITIKASSNNITYTTIGLGNTGSVIAEAYRQYCMEIPEGANKLIVNFKNNNTVRLASIYYNVLDENYTVLSGIPRIYNSTDEEGILQADINVNNAKYVLVRFDATAGGDVTYKNIALGNINKYLPYGNIGLEQSGLNIWNEKWELGSLNTTTGEKTSTSACIRSAEYIPLKPNTTYYFKTAYSEMCFYDKDKKFISSTAKANQTFTTDEKTRYLLFRNATAYGETYNNDIIIAESDVKVPYEPYHSPKLYPINLNGNSIAKVGDIKDLLKIYRNGDVEIEKNVEKINLGSLIWYDENEISSGQIRCSSEKLKEIIYNSPLLCTSYYFDGYKDYDKVPDKIICWSNSSSIPFWRIKNSNYAEKIDEMIISLNSVEVYCQLKEPETIKLPSIEPITLWEGTNNFKLITNLDTTMTTNYGYISVGDIKNLIDVSDFNITYEQGYSQEINTQFLLKPNYIYTLSFDYNVNDTTTDIYYSVGYGINSYEADIQLRIQYKTLTNGRNSVSFTVPGTIPEGSYLWVKFAQTIILADINVDISKIQLESGNKSTDYQSPTLYNIYPTSASKNIYDYDNPIYIIKNNIIYSTIQNGYNIAPQNSTEDCNLAIGYKNLLVPGNTYAISFNQLGNFKYFKLYTTDKNSQEQKQEIEINNGIFVAPDGFYDLQLVFAVDNSLLSNSLEIWNIQIETNNIITEYENHISNSSIITLDEPLRGFGDRKDLICLESPNVLNHKTLSGTVTGNTTYYLNQKGDTEYHIWYYNNEGNLIKFIDEEGHEASGVVGIRGAFTTHKECVKITITKSTDPDVVDITSGELLNNEVIISKGNEVQAYYPYVSAPSLIRYCKEENDSISLLDTPVVYDLSIDNQNALKVLKTYSPISNVFTNNTLLGNMSLDYINNYAEQETKNAYVLLKCWNANSMPYVIHSNYIDIPEDTSKVFIWMRRKNNLFDLQIEDLGDYNEDDKPIDTDKPVVALDIDLNNVTQTTILVTATAIDETGLRIMRFSKDNGTSWDEVIPIDGLSSSNSYTFENLNPDTTYTIRVEAIDLSGNIGGISQQVKTKS